MNFMVKPELRDEALEYTLHRFGEHLIGTFRLFKNRDGMDIKIMFRKGLPSVPSSILKEEGSTVHGQGRPFQEFTVQLCRGGSTRPALRISLC